MFFHRCRNDSYRLARNMLLIILKKCCLCSHRLHVESVLLLVGIMSVCSCFYLRNHNEIRFPWCFSESYQRCGFKFVSDKVIICIPFTVDTRDVCALQISGSRKQLAHPRIRTRYFATTTVHGSRAVLSASLPSASKSAEPESNSSSVISKCS